MDIGSLTGQLTLEDQLTDKLTEGLASVKKFAEEFDGLMGGLAIGVGVAAAAIVGLAYSIEELGKKGSEINDISNTLDHFAVTAENATRIVEEMREGTKGTVGEMDLMRDSSKLLAAGVNLTADNFKTLSDAAYMLHKQGLGPTKDMLDLVSQSLLTGRTRALEMQIGKIDLTKAEEHYAASLGTTKDQLTAVQKTEAKRAEILDVLGKKVKETGDQQLSFADTLLKGETALEDWSDKLAQAVAASPAVMAAVNAVGDALTNLTGNGDAAKDAIVGFFDGFADVVKTVVPATITIIGESVSAIKEWMAEIKSDYATLKEISEWASRLNPQNSVQTGAELAGLFNPQLPKVAPPKPADLSGAGNLGSQNLDLSKTAELSSGAQSILDMLTGKKVAEEVNKITAALGAFHGKLTLTNPLVNDLAKQLSELRAKGASLTTQELLLADAYDENTASDKKWAEMLKTHDEMQKAVNKSSEEWEKHVEAQNAAMLKLVGTGAEFNKFLAGQAAALASASALQLARDLEAAGIKTTAALTGERDKALKLFQDTKNSASASAADVQATWEKLLASEEALFKSQHPEWARLNDDLAAYAIGLQNIGNATGGFAGQAISQLGGLLAMWNNIREMELRAQIAAQNGEKAFSTSDKIGALANGVTGVIGSTGQGNTAQRIFGGALSGLTAGATIGTMIMPGIGTAIGAGVGAAAGAITGAIRGIKSHLDAGRQAVVDFANSMGGFDALHAKLTATGAAGEQLWAQLTQGVAKGSAAQAQAAIDAITKALGNLDAAVQKYGMTAMDFADPSKKLDAAKTSADALKSSFDVLKGAGYSESSILRQMSGDLNQFVVDAVAAGTGVPPALQPIIQKLIDTKQLSEDAARALLGLGAAGPTLQEVTDAAGRYGLKLADLGPQVHQLSIDEQTKQIVADFNTLTKAGVPFEALMKDTTTQVTDQGAAFADMSADAQKSYLDAGGVLHDVTTGMHHDIQALVTDSLTTGSSLDASMKPIVQKLIDAGGTNGLVDQFGNALTDVSQLHWAKPLNEDIEDLTKALQDLVKTFTGPGGLYDAINHIPRVNTGVGAGADSGAGGETTTGPTGAGARNVVVTVNLDGSALLTHTTDGLPDDLTLRGV